MLKLDALASLVVDVRSVDGTPQLAQVELLDGEDLLDWSTGDSDHVRFDALAPGRRIVLARDGERRAQAPVQLRAGEHAALVITLPRP